MELRDQLQASLGSRYTIKRELRGGMSRVFVAREDALHRDIVIKVLPPELAAQVSLERFKREILMAARLQHPHIVPLLSAGDADGVPYFTMPLIEGESLRARLEQPGPVPLLEAARILREIASALGYAHERGIVHRDVKPDNVLLSGGAAMVSDFGVAKALFASTTAEPGLVTSEGLVLGTPAYMAPEQVAGDRNADHRVDLYALGIVAYEMLTGTPPFTGRTPHELRSAHVLRAPEPIGRRVPGLPPALAGVVMQCLEKNPAARPETADDVMRSIDLAITGGRRARRSLELRARAGNLLRQRVTWIATATLVVGFVAGAVALGRPFSREPVAAKQPDSGVTGRGGEPLRQAGAVSVPMGAQARRIAVLPFRVVGGDTAMEYFVNAMTDQVREAITRLPSLQVLHTSYTDRYRDGSVGFEKIASDLNVGALVTGKVTRRGKNVTIIAELVNPVGGALMWGKTFTRPVADLIAVEDEIVKAVAIALELTLTSQDAARATSRTRTQNVEALDFYLRGVASARASTRDGLDSAVAWFTRAAAADPKYAAPWVGLAKAWIYLADDWVAPAVAYPKAREAILTALRLDSLDAGAYAMLGALEMDHEWNFPKAQTHLARAVELDPENVDARLQLARVLGRRGLRDSMIAEAGRAVALDPASFEAAYSYAYFMAEAGQLDSAAAWLRNGQTLDPDSPALTTDFAWLHMLRGEWAAALTLFESDTTFSVRRVASAAICKAHLKRVVDARRDADALKARRARGQYIAADRIARIYVATGDFDLAMIWLEQAFKDRAGALYDLRPFVWNPIRADPRFKVFAARIDSVGR